MKLSKFLACLLLLPVAACARTSAPEPSAPSTPFSNNDASSRAYAAGPSGEAELPATAPQAGTARGGNYDSAPAAAPRASRPGSAAGSAYQPPAEKKAEERPGLGTTWGETRTSYVSNAPFERADYSRPFAVVALNYNDDAGIQAMARRMGNSYASFDRSGVEAAQGAVSVRLLDESGAPLPSAYFAGQDYVAGADGQRYVIQIENHTGNRFEAVATVDGLDVIDGKDGNISKRGYLIDPWGTLQIDGFRRSQSAVAAFRFGAVKDSYAARKGNDRNVGVIGVAFFHERGSVLPWTERELQRRESANPFPGGFASPPPMR
ncbi:MAG TPA: hypothetical protein VER11_24575 [Polyangiaceae bacterium]|nr:hypothetical protein [Polyangiaceae bacterium]